MLKKSSYRFFPKQLNPAEERGQMNPTSCRLSVRAGNLHNCAVLTCGPHVMQQCKSTVVTSGEPLKHVACSMTHFWYSAFSCIYTASLSIPSVVSTPGPNFLNTSKSQTNGNMWCSVTWSLRGCEQISVFFSTLKQQCCFSRRKHSSHKKQIRSNRPHK